MWITFNEFLRFLLFNSRSNCLSMISNDLQGQTEIVFVVPQAYHPLFVWSTVLFNGRYGYEV